MTDQESLLSRVRKLLAKAERAATEHEADAYNTKAAELIAAYGIDRALLAEKDKATDEITTVRIVMDNPYSRDKAGLLTYIAQALRCKTVLYGTGKTTDHVTVFGFRSDLERVEILYTSLLLQAVNLLTHVRPDNDGWDYESPAAYRRSWLNGFRQAVFTRLYRAENRAVDEYAASSAVDGQSVALVLRDRSTQVDEAFEEKYPDLRKGKARKLSGSGYGDGHRAGQRADLGNARLSGRNAISA